jgi:hypothetical protein
MVRGETVYERDKGILVDAGYGEFIRPRPPQPGPWKSGAVESE